MTGRPLLRLAVAASIARLGYAALQRAAQTPRDEKSWTKTNHRGEPVTLLEGPAVAAGAAGAALVVPGLDTRERLALATAALGAGAFGRYDDVVGDRDKHGFRGHLGALAKGEVTTGTLKIAGIGAVGLVSALLLRDSASGPLHNPAHSTRMPAVDVVINAGLVAGAANLVNLFDLRPGRAIKVSLLASAALAAAGPKARAAAAAPVGATMALLPDDLGEAAMLGDAGANAVGALLGVAAAAGLSRAERLAALGAIAALTATSEKVSFTKVIDQTPWLHRLDMLGRRQAPATGAEDADGDGSARQ